MPRRFRSVEETAEPDGLPQCPVDNVRQALVLSELCRRLHPVRLPSGLHRYRSVHEAAWQRERWETGCSRDGARGMARAPAASRAAARPSVRR